MFAFVENPVSLILYLSWIFLLFFSLSSDVLEWITFLWTSVEPFFVCTKIHSIDYRHIVLRIWRQIQRKIMTAKKPVKNIILRDTPIVLQLLCGFMQMANYTCQRLYARLSFAGNCNFGKLMREKCHGVVIWSMCRSSRTKLYSKHSNRKKQKPIRPQMFYDHQIANGSIIGERHGGCWTTLCLQYSPR